MKTVLKINVGLVSLGCSKNLVDSEVMLALLGDEYNIVSEAENADVLIVNTCGFIDSAKEESINTILEMGRYKSGRCKALIAAGCLAQRYHDEILKEMPEVDAVVGTKSYHRIKEIIRAALDGEKKIAVDDLDSPLPQSLPRLQSTPSYTAFLKIAEGCDNRCTYCIIPKIRGKYVSRPMEELITEAESLAKNGVKELIVVAQDTTRYGLDIYGEKRLSGLLSRLCKIDGLEWIRLHYAYPDEVDDALIEVIKNEPKILKYLDIPIQHSSDRILKKMGRRCTRESLIALIEKIRSEIPDIVLRTSLIVGFPGETEEDFEDLCDFVRKIEFDRMGVFKYSREEGTPAAEFDNQVDEEEKERRYGALMQLQRSITQKKNKKRIGQVLTVLTEGFEENLYYGRSYADSAEIDPKVYFGAMAELSPGDMVRVKIVAADDYDLFGEMAGLGG